MKFCPRQKVSALVQVSFHAVVLSRGSSTLCACPILCLVITLLMVLLIPNRLCMLACSFLPPMIEAPCPDTELWPSLLFYCWTWPISRGSVGGGIGASPGGGGIIGWYTVPGTAVYCDFWDICDPLLEELYSVVCCFLRSLYSRRNCISWLLVSSAILNHWSSVKWYKGWTFIQLPFRL